MDASFWLGALVGAAFGVLGSVFLQPPLETLKRRAAGRVRGLRREVPLATELRDIGLYQIFSWSHRRPLDPGRHAVVIDHRPRPAQEWFDANVLDPALANIRSKVSGEVCEVTSHLGDHGEAGEASKGLTLKVRPSPYADSLVIPSLLASEVVWAPVRARIEDTGILEALDVAPPRSFFVMLSLTTASGLVLYTRRSASAASAAGIKSLGVCETMNEIPTVTGHAPETLFDLAWRAAWEEIGLSREQLGPIWYTWYGFGRYHGQFAVAHVKTSLKPEEVEHHARNAEAGWEADRMGWLSIHGPELKQLAAIRLHEGWLPLTPVVARDLIDIWPFLGDEPKRR